MSDPTAPAGRRAASTLIDVAVPTVSGDVLLGLGSNLGDPPVQLVTAVRLLARVLSIATVSDVYLTEPVGVRRQPDFFNLVLRGQTGLPLGDLLAATQAIEKEMGRKAGVRYGPRLIDIDVLAYGDVVVSSEVLVVPHPWLHRRSFVLAPLAEIAPEWRHPVLGTTAGEMLAALKAPTEVTRLGPLAWK